MKNKKTDSIQFGEGNFLRAFVDYCIQLLNENPSFSGRVDLVQPIPQGMIEALQKQGGKYHLFQEGVKGGKTIRETKLIDCIRQMINPYKDFESFLKLGENEHLTFIFSNTTEAGIALDTDDLFAGHPPNSFPAKLTLLLYRRYQKFNGDPTKVLHILPCELIEKNGARLKEIILTLCDEWQLEDQFKSWIKENQFYNTLVDRIVPGFPKENLDYYKKAAGFDDQLMVTCEPFFLWVIEGDNKLLEIFPVDQLENIDVKVVPDLGIYRTRKVRILNGSHTTLVPVGLLHGVLTVSESLQDDFLKNFLTKALFEEIIPSVDFDRQALEDYAQSVLERFSNPFINHQLESIALNSISKFKVRVLPSLLSYYEKNGMPPAHLSFALGALIYFYGKEVSGHSFSLKDDAAHLSFFDEIWKDNSIDNIVQKTLSNTGLWDQDLTKIKPIKDQVSLSLKAISTNLKISEAYEVYIKS